MVDQDLPYQACGDSEKVRAILPLRRILSGEAQVGFMHQSGTLQRVVTSFPTKMVTRDTAQFGIDQWH